jgi:peptidoglycan-associated lipoprotein
MRYLSIVFTIFCFSSALLAQPMTGYSYKVMIETADKALNNYDYYNALDWFEQAYDVEKSDELAYTIAHLHMLLRDYNLAERWFGRIARNRKAVVEYPESKFYWGRMLKQNGKIKEAEEQLSDFVNSYEQGDSLVTLAKLELEGIRKMKEFKPFKPVEAIPLKDLNCKHTDGSPYLYSKSEMYYTSFNADSIIVLSDDDVDFEAKIYRSNYSQEDGWKKGEPLGININRIGYHTSNPTFSKDRQRMYFTRSIMKGNEVIESTIYVAKRDGAEWTSANPISGGVNGDFISTHPSIGELYGREVLFFASNKDGGEGGFDLYFSTILGDTDVAEPVNLGPKINTANNEITPFYRDGNLYFSSLGHPGFGGYDLFYTEWNGSEWSMIKNMGDGFNSPADDLHLYLDETLENGFLVSNRVGGKFIKSKTCCDDIYAIAPAQVPINLQAVIGEKRGGLRGGTIRILELKGEGDEQTLEQKNNESNKFDIPLKRDKSYIIIAEHPKYLPDTFKINTVGVVEAKTYQKKFVLEPRPIEEVEVELVTINEPVRLSNIYYDYDDDKILPSAEKDLNVLYELLVQYPDMIIELSSHTDARGSDSYNMRLSQRRADSAKKYLVAKGAATGRIKAVGYGETQILNDCINNVECSEDDHQYNRRTEFKILSGPEKIEIKRQITKEELARLEKERKAAEDAEFKQRETERLKALKEAQRKQAAGKPEIKFDVMSTNLGRMRQGEKKTYTFNFTNTGKADLEIEMVSACECTTVEWPSRPVKPGQKGQIKMTFDSTNEPGQIDKTLDVIHNGTPPVTELKYKANVMPK